MLRAIHSSMVGRIFSASKGLVRYPAAPHACTRSMCSRSLNAVRIMTHLAARSARTCLATLTPSSSGIWMSSSATSGADARQPSTASIPSQASPTTRYPGSPSKKVRKVRRTPSSSSARKMVVLPILVTPIRLSSRFTKKSILKRTKTPQDALHASEVKPTPARKWSTAGLLHPA